MPEKHVYHVTYTLTDDPAPAREIVAEFHIPVKDGELDKDHVYNTSSVRLPLSKWGRKPKYATFCHFESKERSRFLGLRLYAEGKPEPVYFPIKLPENFTTTTEPFDVGGTAILEGSAGRDFNFKATIKRKGEETKSTDTKVMFDVYVFNCIWA